MKKILVDPGEFYTKVYVLCSVAESDRQGDAAQGWEFYGRSFFPSLVSRADEIDKGRIYYEHDTNRCTIGYDCCESLTFEQVIKAFKDPEVSDYKELLILKKIIFDYADNADELEIDVVVDSPHLEQVYKAIADKLHDGRIVVTALRGYDKRRIKKEVTVRFSLPSSGEAVVGFLKKINKDFSTALLVDVGYNKTKIYMIDSRSGVELFRLSDFGISFYYEKIVRLLSEKNIRDNSFLWLVKQIELGCKKVEVNVEQDPGLSKVARAVSGGAAREYDVSLVLDNVRWDLNKELNRLTSDILTSYYTNTTVWAEMLVVTGGGALFNGDILSVSLAEGGYCFKDTHIEKQPMYAVLEGAVISNQLLTTDS